MADTSSMASISSTSTSSTTWPLLLLQPHRNPHHLILQYTQHNPHYRRQINIYMYKNGTIGRRRLWAERSGWHRREGQGGPADGDRLSHMSRLADLLRSTTTTQSKNNSHSFTKTSIIKNRCQKINIKKQQFNFRLMRWKWTCRLIINNNHVPLQTRGHGSCASPCAWLQLACDYNLINPKIKNKHVTFAALLSFYFCCRFSRCDFFYRCNFFSSSNFFYRFKFFFD